MWAAAYSESPQGTILRVSGRIGVTASESTRVYCALSGSKWAWTVPGSILTRAGSAAARAVFAHNYRVWDRGLVGGCPAGSLQLGILGTCREGLVKGRETGGRTRFHSPGSTLSCP